jgi:hypothetical protein
MVPEDLRTTPFGNQYIIVHRRMLLYGLCCRNYVLHYIRCYCWYVPTESTLLRYDIHAHLYFASFKRITRCARSEHRYGHCRVPFPSFVGVWRHRHTSCVHQTFTEAE